MTYKMCNKDLYDFQELLPHILSDQALKIIGKDLLPLSLLDFRKRYYGYLRCGNTASAEICNIIQILLNDSCKVYDKYSLSKVRELKNTRIKLLINKTI